MAAQGRGKCLPSAQLRDQLPDHAGHSDLKTWFSSPRDLEQVVWEQKLTFAPLDFSGLENLSPCAETRIPRSLVEGLTSASREVIAVTHTLRDPGILNL